jgi:hypothetical protein
LKELKTAGILWIFSILSIIKCHGVEVKSRGYLLFSTPSIKCIKCHGVEVKSRGYLLFNN